MARCGRLSILPALPRALNGQTLNLEAGAIVWATTRLRGDLFANNIKIFTDRQSLQRLHKIAGHNPQMRLWTEFLATYQYTLEYGKVSATCNADLLSHPPLPAMTHDRAESTSLTLWNDTGTYMRTKMLADP